MVVTPNEPVKNTLGFLLPLHQLPRHAHNTLQREPEHEHIRRQVPPT